MNIPLLPPTLFWFPARDWFTPHWESHSNILPYLSHLFLPLRQVKCSPHCLEGPLSSLLSAKFCSRLIISQTSIRLSHLFTISLPLSTWAHSIAYVYSYITGCILCIFLHMICLRPWKREMPQSRSRSPCSLKLTEVSMRKKVRFKNLPRTVSGQVSYTVPVSDPCPVLSSPPTSSSPLLEGPKEGQRGTGRRRRGCATSARGSATAGLEGMGEGSVLNQIWSFYHDGLSLDAMSYWTEIVFLSFLFFNFLRATRKSWSCPGFYAERERNIPTEPV